MIEHRPCGACRELVPVDTGCPHWKPGSGPVRVRNRPVNARVAALTRETGRDYDDDRPGD